MGIRRNPLYLNILQTGFSYGAHTYSHLPDLNKRLDKSAK